MYDKNASKPLFLIIHPETLSELKQRKLQRLARIIATFTTLSV